MSKMLAMIKVLIFMVSSKVGWRWLKRRQRRRRLSSFTAGSVGKSFWPASLGLERLLHANAAAFQCEHSRRNRFVILLRKSYPSVGKIICRNRIGDSLGLTRGYGSAPNGLSGNHFRSVHPNIGPV